MNPSVSMQTMRPQKSARERNPSRDDARSAYLTSSASVDPGDRPRTEQMGGAIEAGVYGFLRRQANRDRGIALPVSNYLGLDAVRRAVAKLGAAPGDRRLERVVGDWPVQRASSVAGDSPSVSGSDDTRRRKPSKSLYRQESIASSGGLAFLVPGNKPDTEFRNSRAPVARAGLVRRGSADISMGSSGAAALSSIGFKPPIKPTSVQETAADSALDAEPRPLQGDVYLDGTLLGRWMSQNLAGEMSRSSSGGAGFDIRRTMPPVGGTFGGWST